MSKDWGLLSFFFIVLLALFFVAGCSAEQVVEDELPVEEEADETGVLIFTADGEEFIREGFVCKDGWALTFEHAYLTLASIAAFQTDPPFDTDRGWEFEDLVRVRVDLAGVHTVDLADPEAKPVVVGEATAAPAGRYNALYWELVRAPGGPAEGFAVLLIGTAAKDGKTIEFSLGLDRAVALLGGEYVGDERKGVLTPGGSADVEMTFHFDHLFGDYGEDPDHDINLNALGFGPLAALAVDGVLEVSLSDLEGRLTEEDLDLLVAVMTHLAHVGEGHTLAAFLD